MIIMVPMSKRLGFFCLSNRGSRVQLHRNPTTWYDDEIWDLDSMIGSREFAHFRKTLDSF